MQNEDESVILSLNIQISKKDYNQAVGFLIAAGLFNLDTENMDRFHTQEKVTVDFSKHFGEEVVEMTSALLAAILVEENDTKTPKTS